METNEKIASVKELAGSFKPLENINLIHKRQLSKLDRLALYVTENIGTMGFFILILTFNLGWMGWNIFAPKEWVFDPAYSFLILLFINNILQILFLPLIMVGQNVQSRHSSLKAEHEFRVNLKMEKEIETILLHLEKIEEKLSKFTAKA